MDDDKWKSHPAWGLVRFDRVSHGGGQKLKLFGSALDDHHTYIQLSIHEGMREHHLSQDWYHPGKLLMEANLSAAQFAELLTTMNSGPGVPCTLTWTASGRVPEPPNETVEAERVRESFKDHAKALAGKLKKLTSRASEILKKSPSTAERQEVQGLITSIVQDIEANLPFVLSQFQEASEKLVTGAKAEVDAFLAHAVRAVGLAEIRKTGVIDAVSAPAATPLLPKPKKD